MSISISTSRLTKSYQRAIFRSLVPAFTSKRNSASEVNALSDVSFAVGEGERVGIIGENGAGKSTLLRILAGVESQTSGVLDVQGHVHAALTLGAGLREELSGRDNLILDAQIQDFELSRQGELIDRMIAFADIGEFIERPVRTYSSGMKSRLCFTSLVFVEPEILLIDEALSTGDVQFQKKASAAIKALCDKGRIVFIVSHSIQTIRSMCTRCIWLSQGRIIADGPADLVADQYSEYQRVRLEERHKSVTALQKTGLSKNAIGSIELTLRGTTTIPDDTGILIVGQEASFIISLQIMRELLLAKISLKIVRIDGLCVVEDSAQNILPERLSPGNYQINAVFPEVWLAPGFYSFQVEFVSGCATTLRQASNFRVVADNVMQGGAPLLYRLIDLKLEVQI